MAKILIIDDEPMVRMYLRKCLESNCHEVSELTDGAAAERFQHDSPADLVITDIFMPGQDGLQTIARLRAEYPDLSIIAMSGGPLGCGGIAQTTMLNSAKALGAVDLLEKPFGADQLLEAVSGALAR